MKKIIITLALLAASASAQAEAVKVSKAKVLRDIAKNPAVQGALTYGRKWSGSSRCLPFEVEQLDSSDGAALFKVFTNCIQEEAATIIEVEGIYYSDDTDPMITNIKFDFAG